MDRDCLCGTYSVLENRSMRNGRRIPLRIVILPARSSPAEPDAVFYLVGGPGQAATESAARAESEEAEANVSRDIVLADQRGTGGSNPLSCRFFAKDDLRNYFGAPPDAAALRACRRELEKRADLERYTTADAVADLDDLRQALGYERVNLDAGSYGTRVALAYMRAHPARVRAAVLRGLNPPDYGLPLPFARAGQDALDRLIGDCTADAACHEAFPDFEARLHEVLARLRKAPVAVGVLNPATEKRERASLSGDFFVSRLHLLLLSPSLSSRVPYLVDRASRGDFEPFADLAAQFGQAISEQIYFGMQLSVICAEDVPFLKEANIRRETSGTFLRDVRVRQAQSFCRQWPAMRVADKERRPVESDAPTLLISGDLDAVTPGRFAESVARHLTHGQRLTIPFGGHINEGACVDRIASQFLEKASLTGVDTSCIQEIRRPKFFIPPPPG